ncbi:MAG: hypothetical protein GY866_36830 [Proteobacteria bacterium]|nr:hypothetical protein [Pseudomonadota bacterium]
MTKDFKAHNEEVAEVWKSYNEGNPIRVPMILGLYPRLILSNPDLNVNKVSYYEYYNDPDKMMDVQLQLWDFVNHNIYADHPMGLPNEWAIALEGGNFHHAAWYGCEINYTDSDGPDVRPMLSDDNKNELFDKGIPDPFGGIYAQYRDMYERMLERAETYTYKGVPISKFIYATTAFLFGNGVPFTTACKLRGASEMCLDLMLDPEYAKKLMNYITDAVVERCRAWRKYVGLPLKLNDVFLGDDSVILISPKLYEEIVLPCHKRLYEELGTPDATRQIHLCGKAAQHFEVLRKEANVSIFDSGFPIDLADCNAKLGPEARLNGGVRVETIRTGTPEVIRQESKKILQEMKEFKRFVFRDANNIAPGTPVENMNAMYQACRKYGQYE